MKIKIGILALIISSTIMGIDLFFQNLDEVITEFNEGVTIANGQKYETEEKDKIRVEGNIVIFPEEPLIDMIKRCAKID